MNASYTILPVPALMQIKESAFGRWTGNRFCGITPGGGAVGDKRLGEEFQFELRRVIALAAVKPGRFHLIKPGFDFLMAQKARTHDSTDDG